MHGMVQYLSSTNGDLGKRRSDVELWVHLHVTKHKHRLRAHAQNN